MILKVSLSVSSSGDLGQVRISVPGTYNSSDVSVWNREDFTAAPERLLRAYDFVRNIFVTPHKVEEGTQERRCQETLIRTVWGGVREAWASSGMVGSLWRPVPGDRFAAQALKVLYWIFPFSQAEWFLVPEPKGGSWDFERERVWASMGGRYDWAWLWVMTASQQLLRYAAGAARCPSGRHPRARLSAGECDEQPKSPASRKQNRPSSWRPPRTSFTGSLCGPYVVLDASGCLLRSPDSALTGLATSFCLAIQ